jgi:single-strand DNA-binding protein
VNCNRVVISGNLTRDPEIKYTPSGDMAIAELSIAVNGREKNRDTGEWEDRPDFFDVTVFGRRAENCAEYLSKGRGVIVDGRLRQDRWQTQSGDNRSKVRIVADQVHFLPARNGDGQQQQAQQQPTPATETTMAPDVGAQPSFDQVFGTKPPEDDDIPF